MTPAHNASGSTMPPRLACWLLERTTVVADREVLLGDLIEEFQDRCVESPKRAARWFWRQSLTSLIPTLRRRWPAPLNSSARGHRMDAFLQDLRFGWRFTRNRPLVSLVSSLSLVVGMSLACIVFTILNAAFLRPLPVDNPEELVLVLEQRQTSVNHQWPYLDYVDFRAGQQAFTDLFTLSPTEVNVSAGESSQLVSAELVSASYFQALGVSATSGRTLQPEDESFDSAPVAVVSERLWTSWGKRLPLAVDETIRVNEVPFTVVGLVAAEFSGANIGSRADLWVSVIQQPLFRPGRDRSDLTDRGSSWLSVMGRLRPGVTLEVAAADLNRVERGMWEAAGGAGRPQTRRTDPRDVLVEPGARGDSRIPESMATVLNTLLIAAVIVLVVACANAANLLMARAAARGREMAMRAALGSGRFRLVRLLLFEASFVGGGSAVVALGVSYVGARLAAPFIRVFGQPLALDLSLDWRVGAFVIGMGLVATFVSSLAPIAHVLRTVSLGSLGDGGRSATASRLSSRVRLGLLVSQFAFSLALVVTALLLVRTVSNLRGAPTGFATDEVVLVSVSPRAAQYSGPRLATYLTDAVARLQAEPGVKAASYAAVPPIASGGSRRSIMVPGYEPGPDEDMELNYNAVLGDYFESMGIPIVAGRGLPQTLSTDAPPQTVVNTTMAERYWPGKNPVGQAFHFGDSAEGPRIEVIGVVADAKYRTMREEPRPSFYLLPDTARSRNGTFHVRVQGSPSAALPLLRRALTDTDASVPVTSARTLTSQLDVNISDDRLAMTIALALASAALLLAGVGLFGSMLHMVSQRTKEIGVRIALGSTSSGIRRLVLAQAVTIALVGSAAGLALALWSSSLLTSRLFGVAPFDPASFIAAALVLTTVAVGATLLPASRASRVDPVHALRSE